MPASLRPDEQLIRFAAVGVGGLFVHMGALWVALQLVGLNLYVRRVFSYLVAATFTWACNRTLTFAGAGADGAVRQWAAATCDVAACTPRSSARLLATRNNANTNAPASMETHAMVTKSLCLTLALRE